MKTTQNGIKTNGRAVAAMLSAMIGLLVMGIVHTATVASADFNTFVFDVGRAWIPNAQGIGPYSGKETFLLIGWFVSWVTLHFALRNKNVSIKVASIVFIVGIAIAALLVYSPFIHFILGR